MLEGVKVFEVEKNIDERGYFCEVLRKDWNKEILGDDEIVQANLSITYPGIVRAWHKHLRGQVDFFLVLRGALKICAYDDQNQEINEIITSSEKLQLVRIPGNYWHGFKNISDKTSVVVYFVNRLYDYKNPDEKRRPWDDPSIVDRKNGLAFQLE